MSTSFMSKKRGSNPQHASKWLAHPQQHSFMAYHEEDKFGSVVAKHFVQAFSTKIGFTQVSLLQSLSKVSWLVGSCWA